MKFFSSFRQSKIMQHFIKIYLFKFVTLNAQNAQSRQSFLRRDGSQSIFDAFEP